MGFDICSLQEKRILDRYSALRVKGKVMDKTPCGSTGGRPEKGIAFVRYKGRLMKMPLDNADFERVEIGDTILVSPPVPEGDPCNCHFFFCLIGAMVVCGLTLWGIGSFLHGQSAALLSLAAAGWISVIAWAKICTHEKKKYLRDLESELCFFETEG